MLLSVKINISVLTFCQCFCVIDLSKVSSYILKSIELRSIPAIK